MENQEMELTFSDIIRIFKRRKWLFVGIFITTVLITLVYLFFFATPTYKAEQIVEYKKSSGSSISFGDASGLAALAGLSSSTGDTGLDNEIQKMKSDAVLGKVVDELNLVQKAEENKNWLAKIRGIEYTKRGFIKSIKDKITIETVENTSMLSISYESSDPTQAASIVSLTYDYYTQFVKENYFKDTEKYLTQLQNVFDDVSRQYDQVNKELLDFQTKNKITTSTEQTDPMIQYYADTYMQKIQLESQKANLEIKKETIEKNLFEMDPQMKEFILLNSSNSNITTIKNQIIQNQIKLETLKLNQPNSPQIRELSSTIQVQQQQLQEEMQNILSSDMNFLATIDREKFNEYIQTKTQLELFDITEQVTNRMLELVDQEIASRSPIMYKYFLLQKEQKILEVKYNTILNTLEQENLKKSLYESNFNIITASYVPENPIAPNKKLILAIGGVLGIFLGILGVFVKESSDNKIKDIHEFETLFKIPETTIKSEKDLEKIVNIIYETQNKKIGIIETQNNLNNHSKKVHSIIKTIDPEIEFTDTTENKPYAEKIKQFEEDKQKEKFIVRFNSIESSEYLLYKNLIQKNIVLIKEKDTEIETIEKINKTIKNPIYVYIK
ncbi:GumC family protein [Geotoga petraea]|uniref:Uncharacterized protein involved in exopolysaccharide biosynthesis n=1 Tax=Geotoga petraea TaxID=28234 RepID=A0A1G6PK98_9BACT|nr:Wzz/FepE/Etk N-terminal domain-containing protein [Geotoga petraea]SDC80411.1 Uncharacterized protein involved in exopolysaccharide biosynthesis [Geotoga petraea]